MNTNELTLEYAKLEQLCLATPTCAGFLLAWAQEGAAGAHAALGAGSRYVCKNHIRSGRAGWECDKLAIEIDDALKAIRNADVIALKAAQAAAKEARRLNRLAAALPGAARRLHMAAQKAAKEAREIEREAGFVPTPVIGYNPATAIVITSDDLDTRLEREAAARRRKIYSCRSEGQRAKMRQMGFEE